MDAYFFDPIFADGAFTEERIDAAAVKIKRIFDSGDQSEAGKAMRVLADMLLLAIADGRTSSPQACASHYFTVRKGCARQTNSIG